MISALLSLLMLGVLVVGLAIRRRSPPLALGIMLLAMGGTWFAWRPEDLTLLAHGLGVGRGADLALYLGLSLCFLAIAALLVQLRHLQVRFTLLARELALLQARGNDLNRDHAIGSNAGTPSP
jgi:hypothetical protein